MSVELLLNYAEKQPADTGKIIYCFTHNYGFESESAGYEYRLQKLAIEALINKMKGGENLYFSKLFLAIAEKYLKTHFSRTNVGRGNSFIMQHFDLKESESLRKLRILIIKEVLTLYKNAVFEVSIIKFLHQLSLFGYHGEVSKVLEKDSELIIEFFQRYFSPNRFIHCLIVNTYTSRLSNNNINFSRELSQNFKTKAYELYALITKEYSRSELELSYEAYYKTKSDRVIEYTKQFEFNDYISFFDDLIDLKIFDDKGTRNDWLIGTGVIALFQGLFNRNIALFKLVIIDFLPYADKLKISPHQLIKFMLLTMKKSEAYSLINASGLERKSLWMNAFYTELKPNQIVVKDLNHLEEHYTTAPVNSLYTGGISYLLNYEAKEAGFFKKLVNIILVRADSKPDIAQLFRPIFYDINTNENKLYELIKNDIELLQVLYIATNKVEPHFDYSGEFFSKLLDEDPLFMARYLSELEEEHREDTRDYSFLWLRNDYIKIMEQVDEYFLLDEEKYSFLREYQHFYHKRENPSKDEMIITRQDDYINQKIKAYCFDKNYMNMLFYFIHKLQYERKAQFFKTFLMTNKNLDGFKALEQCSYSMSWSGSKIPLLKARIEHLEKIMSFCNSVELLEHRSYLTQLIEYEREDIKIRQKKEYMDEDYF